MWTLEFLMAGVHHERYLNRTTPLRGVWQHPRTFMTEALQRFADVVNHYDAVQVRAYGKQKADLVEYLKSL